jgi:hypothetical protein
MSLATAPAGRAPPRGSAALSGRGAPGGPAAACRDHPGRGGPGDRSDWDDPGDRDDPGDGPPGRAGRPAEEAGNAEDDHPAVRSGAFLPPDGQDGSGAPDGRDGLGGRGFRLRRAFPTSSAGWTSPPTPLPSPPRHPGEGRPRPALSVVEPIHHLQKPSLAPGVFFPLSRWMGGRWERGPGGEVLPAPAARAAPDGRCPHGEGPPAVHRAASGLRSCRLPHAVGVRSVLVLRATFRHGLDCRCLSKLLLDQKMDPRSQRRHPPVDLLAELGDLVPAG